MLKRLTYKLFTLFVLVFALTFVLLTPARAAASSTASILICFEAPLEVGCTGLIMCCDGDTGYCFCG